MTQTDSVRASEDNTCCFRRLRSGGVRLIWELISKCNLDCEHCFVRHDSNGIPNGLALRVIEEFPKLPVKKVMFTGGEPFLRKDLLDLVSRCAEQGIIVDITSNLSLLSDARIAQMKRIGVAELTTSLDGPQPVHDEIRCADGNFEHVTHMIAKLKKNQIKVDVVCVAQNKNADFISRTIESAHRAGAASITVSGFNARGRVDGMISDIGLTKDQEERVVTQIQVSRQRFGDSFPIRTVSLINRFERSAPCPVQNIIAIDAHGFVSNCLLAPVPRHEKVHVKGGLANAWQNLNRDYCCSQTVWERYQN